MKHFLLFTKAGKLAGSVYAISAVEKPCGKPSVNCVRTSSGWKTD